MNIEKNVEIRIRTENEYKSGARWFYWVAAMSIINEASFQIHMSWNFAIGLGITQVVNVLFQNGIVSGIVTLILAGVFLFFGKMAHKGYNWAFIVGMIVYSLDGILFILAQDYIGLGIHVFALYYMYRGMKAYKILVAMNSQKLDVNEAEIVVK
nr:hypothetical protein [uncultured Anaeromusa sp.]